MTVQPAPSCAVYGGMRRISIWVYAISVFFTIFLSFSHAMAENSLPLQFDPRERLPKPDLSLVTRIRFLTTVDFAPFNFIDQTGRLSGFHVDLAREICRQLKVLERCQIEAVPYATLIEKLEKGEGEVIIAGVAVTAELKERFSFSRPFAAIPARFLTAKGKAFDPATAKDDAVAVLSGTVHERMLRAYFPRLKPIGFRDRPSMFKALSEGKVAAMFGDGLSLAFAVEAPENKNCCALAGGPYYGERFLGEGLTMMTHKDDPLVDAINHALADLARAGRLNELYLRYFPNGM